MAPQCSERGSLARTVSPEQALGFSLVVPVHNEQENVPGLLDEIQEVLAPLGSFEAILVDDASTDASCARLLSWKEEHGASWLRVLSLETRVGQSGAVLAGIDAARADIVCMMDGDMQNDPRDLVEMLGLLQNDPELAGVSGIRLRRNDGFVRRVSSLIGNGVRNFLTRDRVRDSACGIKAFRRHYVVQVPRFNGMHRFMPTLVRSVGGEVREVVVRHRPRAAGTAKYGIGNRAMRGLRDCLGVRWYRSRVLNYQIEKEL